MQKAEIIKNNLFLIVLSGFMLYAIFFAEKSFARENLHFYVTLLLSGEGLKMFKVQLSEIFQSFEFEFEKVYCQLLHEHKIFIIY